LEWVLEQIIFIVRRGNPEGSVGIGDVSHPFVEQVADLKGLPITGYWGDSQSVAPDGSPILLRNIGTQDIYALDFESSFSSPLTLSLSGRAPGALRPPGKDSSDCTDTQIDLLLFLGHGVGVSQDLNHVVGADASVQNFHLHSLMLSRS
jgi:hypothetical protein